MRRPSRYRGARWKAARVSPVGIPRKRWCRRSNSCRRRQGLGRKVAAACRSFGSNGSGRGRRRAARPGGNPTVAALLACIPYPFRQPASDFLPKAQDRHAQNCFPFLFPGCCPQDAADGVRGAHLDDRCTEGAARRGAWSGCRVPPCSGPFRLVKGFGFALTERRKRSYDRFAFSRHG